MNATSAPKTQTPLNRRMRRAAQIRKALQDPDERVPLFGPDNRAVALMTPIEANRHLDAPNARAVRDRKTGRLIAVRLKALSDDSTLEVHRGNPRRYSHDHETAHNPPRVWTIRHIGSDVRDIFRASVLDNLKKAA